MKRFDFYFDEASGMTECGNGDYVLYSDTETLRTNHARIVGENGRLVRKVEKLTHEIERVKASYRESIAMFNELQLMHAESVGKLAECEKDAARYRWLREKAISDPKNADALELVVPMNFSANFRVQTDEAIDAALQQSEVNHV